MIENAGSANELLGQNIETFECKIIWAYSEVQNR